eukprot:8182613-Pyramimonas_sp.AAC.1
MFGQRRTPWFFPRGSVRCGAAFTLRGDQSREGGENIPAGGASHVRGERMSRRGWRHPPITTIP